MAAVPQSAHRLLAAVPWLLPVLVLLAGAAVERPPPPLALAGAGALLLGLGVAGWRLAGATLPAAPWSTRATAALVLATLGVVLPATTLGHAGQLWPRPFLLVIAGLVAVVGLLSGRGAGPGAPPGEPLKTSSQPGDAAWRRALRAAAFAAVALGALGALHAERYRAPAKVDDASYHLATVAAWHHYGDLRTPKFGFGDSSTPFYPIGSELVDWALLAPLRDSDFVLRWAQLLYFLGTMAAAAAVARELGFGRWAAATAALLLPTVRRAFPELALSAGNDHSTAFFAVAAAAAALRLARRPSAGAAVFAGAALGLLVGSKYLGLLLAAPLGALLLLCVAGSDPPAPPLRRRAALLLAAAAAAALGGGYTYLRNAVSLGNPLFPAPIDFAGLSLPGWEATTLAVRRHLPEFAIDLPEFLLDTVSLGKLFRFTALPAALVAPLVALLAAGPWRQRLRRATVFALPAVFFLEFLHLVHDHRDVRYLFAAIALAAVAFAGLVALAGRRWPWVETVAGTGVALAVVLRFAGRDHLPPGGLPLYALALVAVAALALPVAAPLHRRPRRSAAAAAATLAALGAFAALGPEMPKYQRQKYRHHLIVEALERAAPEGAVIAYAGHNRPYPYFGARLEHRVEQVPVEGPVEARYFTWGGDESIPWRGGRYWIWRRNLEQLGVDYVLLDAPGGPEERWIRRHPEDFAPIIFHGRARLWRFTPAAADAQAARLEAAAAGRPLR